MVCGVNKVRRADTVQIFSAFGIEMVELPLAALALARIEESGKRPLEKPTLNGMHEGKRCLEWSMTSLFCGRKAAGD